MKQKNNFFVYNHTESYKPEDAHLCGDSTYDGYLTYDMDGESLFECDVDKQG